MRTTHPLASRIKKLLQSDEDVGRINMHTPHVAGAYMRQSFAAAVTQRGANRWNPPAQSRVWLTGCAVEELVRQLCGGAAAVAKDRRLKTVTGPCLYVLCLA